MRAVLPGKPRSSVQAISTVRWSRKRLVVYVSGNALVILDSPQHLLQTIYHGEVKLLDAVVVDELSGRIAGASGNKIWIYQPFHQTYDDVVWIQEHRFEVPEEAAFLTLSWGAVGQLLVGSSSLRLYQTTGTVKEIWSQELSTPLWLASFSPDKTMIASVARYDRLVKVWRRLSYGSDEVRFDYCYLSHPASVTHFQWRTTSPDGKNDHFNVLYTVCADQKFRVWAATNAYGLQFLQLWHTFDLCSSIQPRHISQSNEVCLRWCFVVSENDFLEAMLAGQAEAARTAVEASFDHLLDIAKQRPELCAILDGEGHLSVWGMKNVGEKNKSPQDVFHMSHVECFRIISKGDGSDHVNILAFRSNDGSSKLSLLKHHYDGQISCCEGWIDNLLDPTPRAVRMQEVAVWTGHEGSIEKVVRNFGGQAIISRTSDNEGILWRQVDTKDGSGLSKIASLQTQNHIHRTLLFSRGKYAATLHHDELCIWDARSSPAQVMLSCSYKPSGKPLVLFQVPSDSTSPTCKYIGAITSRNTGIAWELRLPAPESQVNGTSNGVLEPSLKQYGTFSLQGQEESVFILPVDPAGSAQVVPSFLDMFAKDIVLAYTGDGTVSTWAIHVDQGKQAVSCIRTANIATQVSNPSLASASSTRKVALVSSARDTLTIWDSRNSQLEFERRFKGDHTINDLDWTSTPDDQSILSVGFSHSVIIFAQIRYDYLERRESWASIREIGIEDATPHPIGDSTWLGNGSLVIGAGNQLFVYDKYIPRAEGKALDVRTRSHDTQLIDLFELTSLLNGPLPVYHPQLISQCLLSGKIALVHSIIGRLNYALKFFAPGDDLDSMLEMQAEDFFLKDSTGSGGTRPQLHPRRISFSTLPEHLLITEEITSVLNENLSRVAVPGLSSTDQIVLANIVECVATAEKQRRSMDDNALRYLLFFRQRILRNAQSHTPFTTVSWREIAWAYHSNSQEILVDLISQHYNGRVLWTHAKGSGMFMWMDDLSSLRAQFEVVAKNEYTKSEERNPIDCSLYYLALRKKAVLHGLWRVATWHREQSGTFRLLANDFTQPRWQAAARKNAYALMGKRRFEYAAAFFLLAGDLQETVNICASQLSDLQLAIAVARVYEDDDGPVLRSLLEDQVLPQAAFEGDRWMAMWAFWMLGRRDMAVRSLITPVYTLLDSPETPSQQAKSYLATDPALVVLYQQLREKSLQAFQGASKISPRAEWEFVMQIARLYDRMGCDLLALDLVRNWEFLKQAVPEKRKPREFDPRQLLRRRSSIMVDDVTSPKSPVLEKKPEVKPPPTMFEEPAGSDLLDAFGF